MQAMQAHRENTVKTVQLKKAGIVWNVKFLLLFEPKQQIKVADMKAKRLVCTTEIIVEHWQGHDLPV